MGKRYSENLARNERICRMREEGIGPREIARRTGVSPSTVAGVLWRAGMTDKNSGIGRGNGADPAFIAMVVADAWKMSDQQAADKWGVNPWNVAYWRSRS